MADKIALLSLMVLALVSVVANYIYTELKSRKTLTVLQKPNQIIIAASLISSALIFYSSTIWRGVWHEFLINLSAGMVSVGIAVLLVDMLRERHLEQRYKAPKAAAIKRIRFSNSAFALTLAVKNYTSNPEILKALFQGTKSGEDSPDANNDASIEALRSLRDVQPDKVLENYTYGQLESDFKQSVQGIRDAYTDINAKYGFALSDIEFRTDYAQLLENLDTVLSSVIVVGVGEQEMQKLFKPIDPSQPGQPLTIHHFMGVALITYIKSYVAFIDKYS